MLIIVGIYYTFYFFVVIFAAQPVQYYWLRYAPNPPKEGHINDEVWAIVPTMIGSVLNAIVDWALAILPMFLVWKAKLDRQTKASVCFVLGVGSM